MLQTTHKQCFIFLISLGLLASCTVSKEERQVTLYKNYCASCHIAPDLNALPKQLWESKVLPEMASRMGIRDPKNHPYLNLPFAEQAEIIKTGIYPGKPIIKLEDWQLLKDYILTMAPETMPKDSVEKNSKELQQFVVEPLALDSAKGSLITYLKHDAIKNSVITGTVRGRLFEFDIAKNRNTNIGRAGGPISDFSTENDASYITTMGSLLPSEISSGQILKKKEDKTESIAGLLHRPVHSLVHDMNQDGRDELVVSEFGDLRGKLSLLIEEENGSYRKQVLLDQPGIIRVLAKDMNDDGKEDLIALTSQGDESITIFYQKENLQFDVEKAIRFSPVYGSSWFELVDYDGDGDQDIITVNGDNADETYVQKPYHGMRIHINDGNNAFEENFFYPMNGATRIIAKDFDKDGDFDMALLSTFPDYDKSPEYVFVYLENKNAVNFDFQPFTHKNINIGKWFLMDSGDVDEDGDEDIILSAFTYGFSPSPEEMSKKWNESRADLLFLKNELNHN